MNNGKLEKMSDEEILEYLNTLEPLHDPDIYEVQLMCLEEKYQNDIIPMLPHLISQYVNEHWNYLDVFMNKELDPEDLIYFLRNKKELKGKDLLYAIVRYAEIKNGIFK